MGKSCVGDHYNVGCPHCDKVNHYVDQVAMVKVPETGGVPFCWPCHYCQKMVHYRAERYKEKGGFPGIRIFASCEDEKQNPS